MTTSQQSLPLFTADTPWWFAYQCRNAAQLEAALKHFRARYGEPTRARLSKRCPEEMLQAARTLIPHVEVRANLLPFDVWLKV